MVAVEDQQVRAGQDGPATAGSRAGPARSTTRSHRGPPRAAARAGRGRERRRAGGRSSPTACPRTTSSSSAWSTRRRRSAIWHVDVVTGLLQTEDYARHIIGSYSRVEPVAPGMIGRLVRVRMRRQQVLDRDGLQLSVVLDESVLKRRIGDEAVMYDQLQRLVKEADRPNLTLQVLPLDAQHSVFGESFVIFGFGQDADAMLQDVVSTEHLRSGFTLEGSATRTCTGSRSRCSSMRRSTRRRPGRSSSKQRRCTGRAPSAVTGCVRPAGFLVAVQVRWNAVPEFAERDRPGAPTAASHVPVPAQAQARRMCMHESYGATRTQRIFTGRNGY